MSKPTVERRAHARYRRSLDIQGTSATDGAVARMMVSDLSLGGLYCTSTDDFPEMTRLSVRLMIPEPMEIDDSDRALDLEAVVVRRQKLKSHTGNSKYELALFFTHMTDAQRKTLARLLAQA